MPKALKVVLWGLAAVAGLLVIAGAIVIARFDPNALKPLLVERMQQDRQRTLAIPGDIGLSLFPRIGVKLGAVSLSAHASREPFASLRSARVSLALLPLLLRRQWVVDRVEVDGLRATVTRYPDGRTSIDDLLGPPASKTERPTAEPPPMQFDVAGLSVTDAAVTVDDRQGGRRIELTKVDLETGRIAPGRAGDARFTGHVNANPPLIDADLALKGSLMLDPAQRRYAFRKLSAELGGRVATLADAKLGLSGDADLALQPLVLDLNGVTMGLQGQTAQGRLAASLDLPQLKLDGERIAARAIVAKASLQQGPRKLQAQLSLPAFSGSAQAFNLPAIDAELRVDDGALHAQARLSGAVDGDVERLRFSSPQAKLVLGGKQGGTELAGTLTSPWTVDLKAQTLALPRIAAEFALPNPNGGKMALSAHGGASASLNRHSLDATLSGKLDDSSFDARFGLSRFAPAVVGFDLSINRIDVDRYRVVAGPPKDGAAPAPETPLDLSALRDLDAKGSLRVGALQVAGVKLSQLRVDLRAAGGRVELDPLAAELYQGRVAGSVALVASTPPRVTIQQRLSNVSVGPLLKDAFGKDLLAGRGNVALDVTAQGGNVGALLKALAGSARIELRDGSVRGFNIAQALRSAKARLGGAAGEHAGTGTQAEATDFSELAGSFAIAGGVAHNDDLLVKSPLLRMTGSGDIDLGQGRLDYLVKATVVDTLQGQGGPELQSLRGQTVPVRLSGPFSAIGYRIDFAGLVQEMAKKKFDARAEDLKAKAQQQLGEKLKDLFGK